MLSTAMVGFGFGRRGHITPPVGATTRAPDRDPRRPRRSRQSGSAHGSQKVVAGATDELSEQGDYTTTGQLGTGSYFIDASSTDLVCDGAPTATATGTASLLRMDGSLAARHRGHRRELCRQRSLRPSRSR